MEYDKYRIYVEKGEVVSEGKFAYIATMEYGHTELNRSFYVAMYSLKGLVNAFLKEMGNIGISVADTEFRINKEYKEIDATKETIKFIVLLNKEVKRRWSSSSSKGNNKGGKTK